MEARRRWIVFGIVFAAFFSVKTPVDISLGIGPEIRLSSKTLALKTRINLPESPIPATTDFLCKNNARANN